MDRSLTGVRVLEVAQYTFGPSAGAVLARGSGPWAVVQDGWEVGNDPALVANGRVGSLIDQQGKPQKLVANPVSFDGKPVQMSRAPQFAEHTEEVMREIGLCEEELIGLKFVGAIT